MTRGKVSIIMIVLFVGIIADCSGGGGSDAPAPLAPPAFTNLAGTRWNQKDTVSAVNTCGTGIGVADPFVLHVLAQSGNAISFYDERSGVSGAVNGTMSGYAVTFSGSRYPVGGCVNMTASYNVTINAGGTAYAGTGTLTCLDNGCTAPVTVSGTKI